jgi:hypothetical protein
MAKKILLSMYMLKTFLSIGMGTTLILGIILLYVLLYAFLISQITAQILPEIRNGFIIAFVATSIMMIISSLVGIYGVIKKYNKFVIAYSLAMTVYFVIVVVMLVLLYEVPTFLEA